MFTWTSLRVTRSMKRRRNESFQPRPASRSELFDPLRSSELFNPLGAPPLRLDVPRASFRLTDLPSEIGILIADRLDTASRASMVLVNRTTASWISKSLLARVNACQLTDDAEVLERDDSPETVARFVSAVASVCIPKDERTKFVAGIVQLHSRPDARVPTFGVADECGVLRSVVGKWSPERQGEVLAQYLQTEIETLKPISHFKTRPGDSGALNQATDERIFRVLKLFRLFRRLLCLLWPLWPPRGAPAPATRQPRGWPAQRPSRHNPPTRPTRSRHGSGASRRWNTRRRRAARRTPS